MPRNRLSSPLELSAVEDDSWPRKSEHPSLWGVKRRTHKWRPPTDVYETEEAYQVRVEIAGMRGADFAVTFERQVLVIQGARSDAGPRKEFRQLEIAYGEFETTVEIPEPVEVSRIEAAYQDGFLKVELPKLKPRRVSIEE